MDCLNLKRAFEHVWEDKRDDAWPDVVGYHDYKHQLAQNQEQLLTLLKEPGQYRARPSSCLEMPKKGFTLRPGIVPCLQDRIVYQALADLYAPHFQPEVNAYNNRLAGEQSKSMFEPGVKLWKAFQDKVEEYCGGFAFVVETDVTAYFDHIYHNLLLDRIGDLFGAHFDSGTLGTSKTLLKHLLTKWSGPVLKSFGIPQVNDASSFFANLYLDEFDKWAVAHGYVYLRYVDDIRIFAHSEAGARRALADVIVKLRQMGLYVASAKTRIRPSQQTAAELSQRRATTTLLESAFESRTRHAIEAIVPQVEELFISLVEDANGFDDRLLRYCVNRLKRLKAWGLGHDDFYDYAIERVIAQLRHMPQSTDTFVDFLSAFPQSVPMQNAILDFLEDSYNVYPWQQMHLLELLIRCNLASDLKDRANQLVCKVLAGKCHPACGNKAIILRGKNGTYADRRDIRDQYSQEPQECVRRAIIVGIQELQPGVRDHFYKEIEAESPGIRSTVNYVQSLPEPTYHHYNPPSFPDLIDENSDDLYDLGSDYFA